MNTNVSFYCFYENLIFYLSYIIYVVEVEDYDEADIENQILIKSNDEALLDKFKAKIAIERQYILFGELPPSGNVESEALTKKQNFIRNKLGLGQEGREKDINFEFVFKLIDALNMQTLFVYDPNYERFSTYDGKKLKTTDASENSLSYFITDDRE